MDFTFSTIEQHIIDTIGLAADHLGLEAYIIGGFVRDKIMQRPTKDIDIVCVGSGIDLAHHVATYFSPKPSVSFFKNFGTAQLKIDQLEIEFVGARKESYEQHSRKPHVSIGSLQDDQQRRDLTINALAIGLNKNNKGQILDPFEGIEDIKNKILKTPLDPDKTFIDDPLRMMRTIRFATQLAFSIESDTWHAIERNKDRIQIISKERIVDELHKILMTTKPSIGFDLLFQSGLLHLIFPKLAALSGAEYIDGKGHKDNFYHTIQVVDNICEHTNNLWLRWSALLHDIGKPATKKFEPQHGWTFHGHEWVGAKMIPGIFKELKMPLNEKMKYVQKLVLLHLRPISLQKEDITDSAIRRLLFDAGDEVDDLMTLCAADITSKNERKVKQFKENLKLVSEKMVQVEEKDKIRNWQPPITGEIIMETFGLSPSKPVGIIKDAVREAILDGKISNQYEDAFAYMIQKAKELNIEPKE
ncbi:MAG: HD domain-containing protein [Chitinophagaceae bacterium]